MKQFKFITYALMGVGWAFYFEDAIYMPLWLIIAYLEDLSHGRQG